MRFSTVIAALVTVAAVSAQQPQNITVVVGQNGTKTYTPTNVTANVGDTIAFQFQYGNHTVTQSTFAAPCDNMTTPTMGIDSGFMPVPTGATSFAQWSFTVTNSSTPLWFHCRQTGHCQTGMVFAVNPTANKTFAAFQAAAMASGSSSSSASTGSSTASSSGSTPKATSTGGAMRYSGSAATALTVVGIVAGVLL